MAVWYLDDDLTILAEEAIAGFQAGQDSDPLAVHLWHEKGNPAGQDLTDLALAVYTEDPASAGEFLRSGVTPQDELWPRVRFVGHNNVGDPTQEDFTTDWVTLGAHRVLPIPTLHSDCARHLEIKFHPPGTAAENFWRFYPTLVVSEHSIALQLPVPSAGSGIETGVGDRARSSLVRGGAASVSAPADDLVHVAARLFVHRGELCGRVAEDLQLDQDDGDAPPASLDAGEEYWALLSQGGGAGVTVTKGLAGASPAKPSLPAGEIFLRWARVDYQAGGTSIIEADDLAGETVYGRHLVLPGTGREARVHPGFALGGGTWRYWSRVESVPLTANDTHYLWQGADGLYSTTTEETPPSSTSLGPWAEIDTDASGVIAIRDRRAYAGRTRVLTLRGATPGAPGEIRKLIVTDDRLWLERVVMRASDNGGGSAGASVAELERTRGGVTVTIYTGSGTDDQRPTIAFDAADLVHDTGIPEVLDLRYGDVITFRTTEHPTGGTPVELEVQLICRLE